MNIYNEKYAKSFFDYMSNYDGPRMPIDVIFNQDDPELEGWRDSKISPFTKQKKEIQQSPGDISNGFLTSVRVCGYENVEQFIRGTLLDLFISSLEMSDGMISIVKNGETIVSYDATLQPEIVMYAITCYAVGKDFDFPGNVILPDTEITNKLLKRAGERFGKAV